MPKCKICKSKFIPRFSTLQPTCEEPKCIIEHSKIQREKKEAKEWSKRKVEMTFDSTSSDGYRSKVIQPIVNEIARLIDYGQPCIATGHYEGKMSGGHFCSVGSNRSCSLNLHNIHVQTFHSNGWKSGDETRYRLGLIKIYGQEYYDFVEGLRHIKNIDLNKERLKELKPLISKIRNDLKRNPTKRTPQERIELRNEINERIGIYSEIFTD
jgi:hypothetical protein